MSVTVIKAPNPLPFQRRNRVLPRSAFLAGSIEMGVAEDWQTRVTKVAMQSNGGGYILNPRRDDWDSSWRQHESDEKFNEQVSWELCALEAAHAIWMYFDPSTKSPITLLELGLFARSGKLTVWCPDGFWRQGNVTITCARYGAECHTGDRAAVLAHLCDRAAMFFDGANR